MTHTSSGCFQVLAVLLRFTELGRRLGKRVLETHNLFFKVLTSLVATPELRLEGPGLVAPAALLALAVFKLATQDSTSLLLRLHTGLQATDGVPQATGLPFGSPRGVLGLVTHAVGIFQSLPELHHLLEGCTTVKHLRLNTRQSSYNKGRKHIGDGYLRIALGRRRSRS